PMPSPADPYIPPHKLDSPYRLILPTPQTLFNESFPKIHLPLLQNLGLMLCLSSNGLAHEIQRP
ncbi:MAG: hypothetical protein SFY92_00110, partial [Verrucomicrobiae bacterium]|nr:hypothetical protein [Verrucomicrobiae bacterium]